MFSSIKDMVFSPKAIVIWHSHQSELVLCRPSWDKKDSSLNRKEEESKDSQEVDENKCSRSNDILSVVSIRRSEMIKDRSPKMEGVRQDSVVCATTRMTWTYACHFTSRSSWKYRAGNELYLQV